MRRQKYNCIIVLGMVLHIFSKYLHIDQHEYSISIVSSEAC